MICMHDREACVTRISKAGLGLHTTAGLPALLALERSGHAFYPPHPSTLAQCCLTAVTAMECPTVSHTI